LISLLAFFTDKGKEKMIAAGSMLCGKANDRFLYRPAAK
jgi:hypothetical protein